MKFNGKYPMIAEIVNSGAIECTKAVLTLQNEDGYMGNHTTMRKIGDIVEISRELLDFVSDEINKKEE